jgi:hypothetical protein
MPKPNTKGVLRYHILEMEIGDYFPMQLGEENSDYVIKSWEWEAWGKNVWKPEIKIERNVSIPLADGVFYFIKVDDGLLVADRVVKTNVSHNDLRSGENNYIQGKLMIIDGVEGLMRSLTGGVTWADSNGKPVYSSPQFSSGGYPLNNEWDRYIVNSNLGGKVIPNDPTVWNHLYHETITQHVYVRNTSNIISRGGQDTGSNLVNRGINQAINTMGFRPVFDFGYKNR